MVLLLPVGSLSGREEVAVRVVAVVAGRLPSRVRRVEVEPLVVVVASGPLDSVVLAGILRATRGGLAVAVTTPRLTAGNTDFLPLTAVTDEDDVVGTTDFRFRTGFVVVVVVVAAAVTALTAATAIDFRSTAGLTVVFVSFVDSGMTATGTTVDFRRNWTSCWSDDDCWFVLRISRSLSGIRRTVVDFREIGDATRFCLVVAAAATMEPTLGMRDFRMRDLRLLAGAASG